MSIQNQIYKEKYFKYKNKYLQLQNKLNNVTGGSLTTATNSFFIKIFGNKNLLHEVLETDRFLMDKLLEKQIKLPIITETSVEDLKQNVELNEVFSIIVEGVDGKIMDEYLKIYLDGQLGSTNSIENKGRYKDAQENLKKLRENKQFLNLEVPTTFRSLTELENYIESNEANFIKIAEKNQSKLKTSEKQKALKEEGEAYVELILDTPNVIIYHPTTEAGSKFYGRNTKWCTSGNEDNRFCYYNNQGPLYIIVPKSDPINKYQLHFETESLMNSADDPVTIQYVSTLLKDEEFDNWFNEKLFKKIKIVNEKLIINMLLPIFKEEHNALITRLILGNEINKYQFNEPLGNSLDNLTNLQQLTFGYKFNQSLGNSLNNLTKLEILTFGEAFNELVGNSLDNLTNLQQLTFGYKFNQPVGNSLDNLTKLEKLTFGVDFNKPLGNSLDKLTNLQQLTFGYKFNQPLGNSLDNLTKLEKLTFGEDFNEPVGNSFDNLTNLQQLTFNSNIPMKNSLDKLINLQQLTFRNFNQPLVNSLDKLTNLQQLTFNNTFNQPLGNSLDKLTNLQQLTFSYSFNQPLGNSLDKLTKLEKLTFGYSFNQPLGNSLDKLTDLQQLSFIGSFDYPLGNSLDKLTNLEQLRFIGRFNQLLGNSLDNLINLQQLTFRDFSDNPLGGNSFNKPLGNSLNKLVNLQKLTLDGRFNQLLGNSLDELVNLQQLIFGVEFTKPFNNSLDKLTSLQKLNISKRYKGILPQKENLIIAKS